MLNVPQQAVVDSDGNTAVIAGPGSGKTRVIIAKILKIQQDAALNRICAVTFTRDATNELTHRVQAELERVHGAAQAKRLLSQVRIGTFHSLAIMQLREVGKLGKLATPSEQSQFINQALRSLPPNPEEPMTYEDACMAIEAAKCSMNRTEDLMKVPVVAAYQRILARNRMGDLFDVIRDAVLGMRDGSIKPMQSTNLPCTHLLVDEFQDTDEVQYAWIREHFKRGVITTVVGDDDQTIFEWRRALGYKGFEIFKEEADALEIVLGDNYRCRSEILSAADTLIRNNRGQRIEKKLVASKGAGGSVSLVTGPDVKIQAAKLVEKIEPFFKPLEIEEWGFEYTVPKGQWSIIARSHAALNSVEKALRAKKVKFTRNGGGLTNVHYIAVYLGLLKSLQKGTSSGVDNMLSLMGVSQDSLDKLHNLCDGRFSRYLDNKIKDYGDLEGKDREFIIDFAVNKSSGWRADLRIGAYSSVLGGVKELIASELLHRSTDDKKKELLEDVFDLLCQMNDWKIRTQTGTRAPTLTERCEYLEKPKEKDGDGVALHTMHSCKGLEFDHVGAYEITEGIIPNPERLDDLNDRRLLYVTMTRAKEHLYMSFVGTKKSRFFQEIGIQ